MLFFWILLPRFSQKIRETSRKFRCFVPLFLFCLNHRGSNRSLVLWVYFTLPSSGQSDNGTHLCWPRMVDGISITVWCCFCVGILFKPKWRYLHLSLEADTFVFNLLLLLLSPVLVTHRPPTLKDCFNTMCLPIKTALANAIDYYRSM